VPTMAKRKKLPERAQPALLEYNFEDCPDAKLSACCQYEYLASSRLIRKTVERWRAGQRDPLTKAVALLFGPDIFWMLKDNWWPHRPYLDIPEAAHQHPVQSPKRQPRNLAHLVTPWSHLFDAANAARIVLVYVPPGVPLSKLTKAFGDLLKRDYPELLVKEPVKTEWRIQKRGRGSLSEQCRTDLKALSAWRLQKQFRYSAQAARDLMRARRLSIYQHDRAFYRAVKRATQKIAALEEQLRQFAKRMTA